MGLSPPGHVGVYLHLWTAGRCGSRRLDRGELLDPSLASVGAHAQAEGFIERLAALSRQAGVPQRLSEVGVGWQHLDLLAAEAMKQERLLVNNPCPISQADARRLYEAAL